MRQRAQPGANNALWLRAGAFLLYVGEIAKIGIIIKKVKRTWMRL